MRSAVESTTESTTRPVHAVWMKREVPDIHDRPAYYPNRAIKYVLVEAGRVVEAEGNGYILVWEPRV